MAATVALFHKGVTTNVNSKDSLSVIGEFKVTFVATTTYYTKSFYVQKYICKIFIKLWTF